MRRYCQRGSLGSLQASQGRGDMKRSSGSGTERGTDTFKWISGRRYKRDDLLLEIARLL